MLSRPAKLIVCVLLVYYVVTFTIWGLEFLFPEMPGTLVLGLPAAQWYANIFLTVILPSVGAYVFLHFLSKWVPEEVKGMEEKGGERV